MVADNIADSTVVTVPHTATIDQVIIFVFKPYTINCRSLKHCGDLIQLYFNQAPTSSKMGRNVFTGLTILFCFGPLSVVGFRKFILARHEDRRENPRIARTEKRTVAGWSIVPMVLGLVSIAVLLVICFAPNSLYYHYQQHYIFTDQQVDASPQQPIYAFKEQLDELRLQVQSNHGTNENQDSEIDNLQETLNGEQYGYEHSTTTDNPTSPTENTQCPTMFWHN